MTKKRARRPASEWAELVSAWRGSGKSQRAFAEERGLSVSTFASWSRQLDVGGDAKRGGRSKRVPKGFSEVEVVGGSSELGAERPVLQVTTPGGLVVRVSGAVDPEAVRAVLQGVSGC